MLVVLVLVPVLVSELETPIWVSLKLDFLLGLIQTKLMIISMPYSIY